MRIQAAVPEAFHLHAMECGDDDAIHAASSQQP
jgi:hypothetical protein